MDIARSHTLLVKEKKFLFLLYKSEAINVRTLLVNSTDLQLRTLLQILYLIRYIQMSTFENSRQNFFQSEQRRQCVVTFHPVYVLHCVSKLLRDKFCAAIGCTWRMFAIL